jgi:pentatricopeptide repeat protein
MAKQAYKNFPFTPRVLAQIKIMDALVTEYMKAGYTLTVRQLYYQMVARGYSPNTMQDYKRIASTLNDARLAGLVDWDGIEDRGRTFRKRSRWNTPQEILNAVARQYHQDLWKEQEYRVFVLVEKEALAGVLDIPCTEFDVPLLACKGYPSVSVLRDFALGDLLDAIISQGQKPVILHLGDHDPSGIDMTRDLTERLQLFVSAETAKRTDLHRIALNMPQVEELNPPENPAKVTDSRFNSYQEKFGDSSWELDALPPEYLDNLVRGEIQKYITDQRIWDEQREEIADRKAKLNSVAERWEEITGDSAD